MNRRWKPTVIPRAVRTYMPSRPSQFDPAEAPPPEEGDGRPQADERQDDARRGSPPHEPGMPRPGPHRGAATRRWGLRRATRSTGRPGPAGRPRRSAAPADGRHAPYPSALRCSRHLPLRLFVRVSAALGGRAGGGPSSGVHEATAGRPGDRPQKSGPETTPSRPRTSPPRVPGRPGLPGRGGWCSRR